MGIYSTSLILKSLPFQAFNLSPFLRKLSKILRLKFYRAKKRLFLCKIQPQALAL